MDVDAFVTLNQNSCSLHAAAFKANKGLLSLEIHL